MNMLQGLYVISDNELTPQSSLTNNITKALMGGAKIVQYRDKINSKEIIRQNARDLQALCQYYDAKFVINDYVDLAIEENFDALHVGESDHENIEQIRKDFKGILGVSCYGDVSKAKYMQDLGVNYVAFGSFFPSPTKPKSSVVDMKVLQKAKEILSIPICVIGGINSENVHKLLVYKPDMVCAISDIWKSKNIQKKVQQYKNILEDKTSK
jgi:thiamine-phosphate pyrophosphorylase